jgi:hypothetical protein
VVLADLRDHLDQFSEAGPDGLVFIGPNGGRLRRRNFHRLWTKALTDAKVEEEDVHFRAVQLLPSRHVDTQLGREFGQGGQHPAAEMYTP